MGVCLSTWIKLPAPLKSKHARKNQVHVTPHFFLAQWHSVIASDDIDDDILDDGDGDDGNYDEDDIAIVMAEVDLSTSFWAYIFFKIQFSEPPMSMLKQSYS